MLCAALVAVNIHLLHATIQKSLATFAIIMSIVTIIHLTVTTLILIQTNLVTIIKTIAFAIMDVVLIARRTDGTEMDALLAT